MKKKRITGFDIYLIICIAGLLAVEIARPRLTGDEELDGMLNIIFSRMLGFMVFLPIAVKSRYRVFGFVRERPAAALLAVLPAILVCVNNFPFIGSLTGGIRPDKPGWYVALFVLQCLSIGLFEEFAFRGVLLPAVLERYGDSKKGIFLSVVVGSALFGLVHLFNLLEGAGAGSVLLQIGYSTLIGGMCAIVLIKTRCIWLCVALHAVFDFGGFYVPSVAEGELWDAPTVAITAVLGVLTAVYMTVMLLRFEPSSVDPLFAGIRIRRTAASDIPELRRIYAAARGRMAAEGNPHQWGDRSYPPDDLLRHDALCGTGRAMILDGRPAAAFAVIPGPDPTYAKIEDGAWKNDRPYAAVHRIASDGTLRGVLKLALDYCSGIWPELRIDTHEDNLRMRRLLGENGFVRCGIIHVEDGSPRIAFSRSGGKKN